MNCEKAIELLPWLLNRTLDTTERDEVRRHLKDCEACRLALAETQEAWEIFDRHLSPADLVSLAYGEAPAGAAPAEAERHLAACARCSAELEMARTSRRLEGEENLLVFGQRRSSPEAAPAVAGRRRWQASAIAAGLAGIIGLGGWMVAARQVTDLKNQLALRGSEGGLMVIATNDPVVLDPVEARQRAGEEAGLTVPANGGSALQLNGDAGIEPAERASLTSYRVEVWREGGDKVGAASVRYLPEGNYAVTVQGLAPGGYELRVFGSTAEGKERPCETYRLKVAG